jgi:hypothetical protein
VSNLLTAYEKWRSTQPLVEDLFNLPFDEQRLAMSIRNQAWDEYCDIRDGLKPGSSKTKRLFTSEKSNVVPIKGEV